MCVCTEHPSKSPRRTKKTEVGKKKICCCLLFSVSLANAQVYQYKSPWAVPFIQSFANYRDRGSWTRGSRGNRFYISFCFKLLVVSLPSRIYIYIFPPLKSYASWATRSFSSALPLVARLQNRGIFRRLL